MMHTLSDLDNFSIRATDGNIGRVKDFYFDDRRWAIRYLVIEIGIDATDAIDATKSHKVLISPSVIKHLNLQEKTLTVDLSVSEINNSPHIDVERHATMQYEIDYLSYYGYAFYWDNNLPSQSLSEANSSSDDFFLAIDSVRRMYGDRHLRSCHEIIHYHIEASDGEIGHLEDMLIDEDTWAIQYCIANTSSWWLGHQVLLTPQIIKDISWGSTKIYVDMTQQQIKEAPVLNTVESTRDEGSLGVYLHRDQHFAEVGAWSRPS